MNRSSIRTAIVAASLLALFSAGCQQESVDPKTAEAESADPAAPLTPEQKFEIIIDQVRRGIEEAPLGFVVQDASGGKTMMTGRNIVTHEIIQPAKEGDPLKAIITVTSETNYSMQRSKVESADASARTGAVAAEDAGNDVQIYDSAVTAAPGADARAAQNGNDSAAPSVLVARADDRHQREYELVYEKDQWRLVSKLDPKTEELIEYVFDRALASQG